MIGKLSPTIIRTRQSAGDMNSEKAAQIGALIERDLAHGILQRREIAWPEIFATAIRLLRRHVRGYGLRSLDSLHVACALANKDQFFITFDQRQGRAASAEKLKVWP